MVLISTRRFFITLIKGMLSVNFISGEMIKYVVKSNKRETLVETPCLVHSLSTVNNLFGWHNGIVLTI